MLGQADVERLLAMDECIAVMARALSDLARGIAYIPQTDGGDSPGARGSWDYAGLLSGIDPDTG